VSNPSTHLLVAPSDATDLVGQGIPSSKLIRKLIKLNSTLFCPDIKDEKHIEGWEGVTSLWIGVPGGGGRPICGIKLGMIPEWTQIDEKGILITKGWRAIFEKIIRAGAVTRLQVETEFVVTLGDGERDRNLCSVCVKEGNREMSNGGARGYCDMHDVVYTAVAEAKRKGPERAERAVWKKEKTIVS
jgi:hypothetical protein